MTPAPNWETCGYNPGENSPNYWKWQECFYGPQGPSPAQTAIIVALIVSVAAVAIVALVLHYRKVAAQ